MTAGTDPDEALFRTIADRERDEVVRDIASTCPHRIAGRP
jgi:hypothetical protein